MTFLSRLPALFTGLVVLGGCAYQGGDISDPIHRKFHWASFVAGDDIAASCSPDLPDRVRLVYNAVWGEQIRIYEWDSLRRSLRVRVIGDGDLRDVTLTDPLAGWRAGEVSVPLDAAAYDGLTAALAESGGFGPPAVGVDLPSLSYYWAAATCRQGRFTFTGWAYPSQAFEAARFPAALFALDPGRDGVHPAGPVALDVIKEFDRTRGTITDFTFKVGTDGMVR